MADFSTTSELPLSLVSCRHRQITDRCPARAFRERVVLVVHPGDPSIILDSGQIHLPIESF